MSEQLPKFEDLSPVEVNDLIAVEIMGWQKFEGEMNGRATGRYAWRGPHTIRVRAEFNSPGQASDIFNPYHDLNDCRLADAQILFSPITSAYSNELRKIVGGSLGETLSREAQLHNVFVATYATAQQKCEAMLKAKGLVR